MQLPCRLVSELGQSRLLCAAKGRQLEEVQAQLQGAHEGAAAERRAAEEDSRARAQQLSQAAEQVRVLA